MARRRNSASSVSTFQIIAAMLLLLAMVIALGYLFAPEKPLAPPTSVVRYEARPETREGMVYERPRGPGRPAPGSMTPAPAEDKIAPAEEDAAAVYRVWGVVTDVRTGQPVPNARVGAVRVATPEEWQAWQQTAVSEDYTESAPGAEDGASPETPEFNPRYARQERTNPAGAFEIRLPYPGTYQLSAKHSDYIDSQPEDVVLSESLTEVELQIQVSMGASIAGRVTESGTSRGAPEVVVSLGRPNEQVRVERFFFGGILSERNGFRRAETDAEGKYLLSGLTPGEYSVALALRDTPYRAGKIMPYRAVSIKRDGEAVTGVNFEVDVAGIVWGYVKDTNDEPVGADLVLCTSDSIVSQAMTAIVKQVQPVTSGSDGKTGYYELVGVPLNEEWHVYATAKKTSPQMSDAFVLTSSHRSVRVDINMFSGSDVAGYVIEPDGTPIPGAQLMCIPAISQLFSPINGPPALRESRSDESGFYTLHQLPAGNFQIHATKNKYKVSAKGEPLFVDGYNGIANFNIVLHPIEEGTEEIFGTVADGGGHPISGAHVNLGGLGADSLSGVDRQTETDAQGNFYFNGVEFGMYMLQVRKEGYASKNVGNVLLNKPNHVVIEAAAKLGGVVLVRETGQPAEGGLVSAVPVGEGGEVSFSAFLGGGGEPKTTGIDAEGRFAMNVHAGTYRLEARVSGYTPQRTVVRLDPGDDNSNVRLYVSRQGGSISGRVVTADGNDPRGTLLLLIEAQSAVESAFLMAMAGDATSGRAAQVDMGGEFLFENLSEGVYNIIAQHGGYPRAESGVLSLASNQRMTGVRIRLGAGGSIEGYVYKNKQPQPRASVVALANGIPEMTNADDRGYYRFDGLAAGMHQLMVVPGNVGDLANLSGVQSVPVEVAEGRAVWQDLGDALGGIRIVGSVSPPPTTGFLNIGGSIRMRAQSAAPLTAPGSLVDPMSFAVNMGSWSIIDQQGNFTIENVPPGAWALDVYYPEGPLQARYVWSQPIEVTGDEQEIPLAIMIPSGEGQMQ